MKLGEITVRDVMKDDKPILSTLILKGRQKKNLRMNRH